MCVCMRIRLRVGPISTFYFALCLWYVLNLVSLFSWNANHWDRHLMYEQGISFVLFLLPLNTWEMERGALGDRLSFTVVLCVAVAVARLTRCHAFFNLTGSFSLLSLIVSPDFLPKRKTENYTKSLALRVSRLPKQASNHLFFDLFID